MPYIELENNNSADIVLGMWKVEEDEGYFMDRLNIYENEEKILGNIRHPHKRLEWLSSRLCLKELLHISHKVESLNETTGKPYLSDHSFNISYSHSNLFAAAIASPTIPVSIDLEDLSKIRNPLTRHLFMSPEELEFFEQTGEKDIFFLYWSSKETLYKMYGKKGVIFKENLLVNREGKEIQKNGTISGIIHTHDFHKEYEIHYRFFPRILLTYTFDPAFVREQSGEGHDRVRKSPNPTTTYKRS